MTVTVRVPGSKSVTHRALLLAARSEIPCTINNGLHCEDTDAMQEGLYSMGYDLTDDGEVFHAEPSTVRPAEEPIHCHNSGTALRLLTAQAALCSWSTTFDGDASLRARPMKPLFDALREGGANIDGSQAPFTVAGPMQSGKFRIDGSVSSQFTSALLLALPFMDGPSTVEVTGIPVSRPYVDLTIHTMEHFGLRVEREGHTYHVDGGQAARCTTVPVPPDWSTAAFYLVAGALTDGVHIPDLHTGTGQPDEAILKTLATFGLQLEEKYDGITLYPGPSVSPGTVDVRDHPDLFPILSVLAACSDGTTTFIGGPHLHSKESDRIHAMVDGLARMGINAKPLPDGMKVPGGHLHGSPLHAYGDHRVHMAFQVAALAADGPVEVDGARTVAVSHPGFHEGLKPFWQVKA